MSYMRNHAVIVTTRGSLVRGDYPSDRQRYGDIAAAVEAFCADLPDRWRRLVIGPVPGAANDMYTYAFLPDGSGEGFRESDDGDTYRARFVELFAYRYEDGSSPFEVVEVSWGDYNEYLQPPTARDPRPPVADAEPVAGGVAAP